VVDVNKSAGMLEGMSPDGLSGFDRGFDVRRGRTGVAGRCEMLAVVGQHRVNDRNQAAEEIGRWAATIARRCALRPVTRVDGSSSLDDESPHVIFT
jgi:hypothetical protein